MPQSPILSPYRLCDITGSLHVPSYSQHCNECAKSMIGKTRQRKKATVEEIFDAELGRARGILRWPPPTGQFRHMRRRPPADLEPWIDVYWMVTWDLPHPFLQETLPHPNVHLIFENGRAVVGGVSTKKFSRVLEGESGVFGVRFRPGGFRPFMNTEVATLLDRVVLAKQVFGADIEKIEALWRASAWQEDKMIGAANTFFRGRLPEADKSVQVADRIVKKIFEDREIKTVDDLVARTGIGKRALQRTFKEYVGVNPKWVIRRYRLHELLERFNAGQPPDWARIALELGYFDQAHLINDFKSITGQSPTQYRDELLAE